MSNDRKTVSTLMLLRSFRRLLSIKKKKYSKVAEWPGLLVWDILPFSERFSCVLSSSCMEGIPQNLVETSGQISVPLQPFWSVGNNFFAGENWQRDLVGIHSHLNGLFSISILFFFFCMQIAYQLQYMQEKGFLNLEKLTASQIL